MCFRPSACAVAKELNKFSNPSCPVGVRGGNSRLLVPSRLVLELAGVSSGDP